MKVPARLYIYFSETPERQPSKALIERLSGGLGGEPAILREGRVFRAALGSRLLARVRREGDLGSRRMPVRAVRLLLDPRLASSLFSAGPFRLSHDGVVDYLGETTLTASSLAVTSRCTLAPLRHWDLSRSRALVVTFTSTAGLHLAPRCLLHLWWDLGFALDASLPLGSQQWPRSSPTGHPGQLPMPAS